VQFFERMTQMTGSAPPRFPGAAYYLGLGLIVSGVALLMISIWDYRKTVAYLWNKDYVAVAGKKKEAETSPIIGVAVVLTIVGIFAFFAVLLRLL
jgi:putative membrane protein